MHNYLEWPTVYPPNVQQIMILLKILQWYPKGIRIIRDSLRGIVLNHKCFLTKIKEPVLDLLFTCCFCEKRSELNLFGLNYI